MSAGRTGRAHVRPQRHSRTCSACLLQLVFVACTFAALHGQFWFQLVLACSTCWCTFSLGIQLTCTGGGSVLFSCLKTRRLCNSMSWSVHMLHFVLCAALSQLSNRTGGRGISCRCTSYCSSMVGCKLWSVVLIRCGVLFGLGLVPGRQQHVVHAVLQSPLCSVFVCLFVPRCTDLQVGHRGLTQNESGLARRVCGCRSGLTQNESGLARRVPGPAAA